MEKRGGEILVKSDPINNSANDDRIKNIAETSSRLTIIHGISDTKLQKLSDGISHIVNYPQSGYGSTSALKAAQDDFKNYRAQLLTRILGKNFQPNDDVDDIITATYQYYQYSRFKRAMFECTDVLYQKDDEKIENGRVKKMKFRVLTELKETPYGVEEHIKFD